MTKYRYKILTGDDAERVRAMVRQVCETFEIRIVSGVVSKDHVHILVSAPPNMAPSEIMRRIKGNTAYLLVTQPARDSSREFYEKGKYSWNEENHTVVLTPRQESNPRHYLKMKERSFSLTVMGRRCRRSWKIAILCVEAIP